MTQKQLKSYLKSEAIAAGIAPSDIDSRVNDAITFGLEEFWGAWTWYFKMKETTFTVTTTKTSYKPPKDFGGLIKIVDQGQSHGGDLEFFAKEDFDRRFPKPASDSAGIPVAVTCFQTGGKWKLQFYPRPTVTRSFNLVYEIDTAYAIETIPKNFTSGLLIAAGKWIPRLASDKGLVMERRADIIYRRLILQNTAHKKPFNALSTQGPIGRRLHASVDPNAGIL